MQEVIINVRELVFGTADVGDIHVVGRRTQLFELLASEDINGYEMDFGVTMLPSLRGAHLNNLTRTAFNDNVSVRF